MSVSRRIVVLVAVAATAIALFAVPAFAATGSDSMTDECIVASSNVNAVRASITPSVMVEEDPAFNHDDPDAADNPLALITWPDEAALWLEAGVGTHVSLSAGADSLAAEASRPTFARPERSDPEVSDSIVRLYCALFGRQPGSIELAYWAGRYWNGLPLVTIAEAMTHAREFVNRYGVVSDDQLAELMYRQVLDREPAGQSAAVFTEKLTSGELHRGQVVVEFTESGEYVHMTGTAAPEKPVLPYPDEGSGRRIIYTNGGQRVWLIDDTGELYKTHQVSGRRGIPGVGRYRIYSMSRYAWAPYDGITMEFMVRFARGEWPYGFHSIPVHPNDAPMQTPAQLGTHRSGGCVRQLWDDAEAVYNWSTVGTRVIVTP